MPTLSHRGIRLRYGRAVLLLITLAVATACSAPDGTSTTPPSAPTTAAAPSTAPTTSAAPTTSSTSAAPTDANTQWAESVCSAARDVRSNLDAIGQNLELDVTATPSALDQVKSTLKAQVATARTSMTELRTAIEAVPVDAEGAAKMKSSLEASRSSLDDAVQAVSDGVDNATAATNARDFVAAAAQTVQAVKAASLAAESFRTTARNAATAAGGELKAAFDSAPSCVTATASPS
jgi:hypothetical protein